MTTVTPANPSTIAAAIVYIAQQAKQRGLDPAAVLAIANQEGLSGNAGDNGHAFGPFQLNDAGGAFPVSLQGLPPDQKNVWAWSQQGIDYALNGIGAVAAGQTGSTAIVSIATFFERPQDVSGEINRAIATYNGWVQRVTSLLEGGVTDIIPQLPASPADVGTAIGSGIAGQITGNPNTPHFGFGLGPLNLPTGLIAFILGLVLLLVGAILSYTNVEKPKITVKAPQRTIG